MLEESATGTLDGQKDTQWVSEQMKPEPSLEAKTAALKLSDLEPIVRRPGALEKTVMLGR